MNEMLHWFCPSALVVYSSYMYWQCSCNCLQSWPPPSDREHTGIHQTCLISAVRLDSDSYSPSGPSACSLLNIWWTVMHVTSHQTVLSPEHSPWPRLQSWESSKIDRTCDDRSDEEQILHTVSLAARYSLQNKAASQRCHRTVFLSPAPVCPPPPPPQHCTFSDTPFQVLEFLLMSSLIKSGVFD